MLARRPGLQSPIPVPPQLRPPVTDPNPVNRDRPPLALIVGRHVGYRADGRATRAEDRIGYWAGG
jgi:hypothetical protein